MERESSRTSRTPVLLSIYCIRVSTGVMLRNQLPSCPEHYQQPLLLLGRCSSYTPSTLDMLTKPCVFEHCSHVQSLHFYMLLMKASHFKRGQGKLKHSTHMNKKNTHGCKVGVEFQGQYVDDSIHKGPSLQFIMLLKKVNFIFVRESGSMFICALTTSPIFKSHHCT